MQANGRSIQEALERALAKLLGHSVRVLAAGRTDSGVHAKGQVACFDTAQLLPMRAFVVGLGGYLPASVSVVEACQVDDGFDPRKWSLGKRYIYSICNRPTRSPLLRRTHWEIFQPLDVNAMQQGAQFLIGRHDFSSFRAADCQASHAIRHIHRLEVRNEGANLLTVTVEGTAFLKHMVRNLVGTLVRIGRRQAMPGWAQSVLQAKDRTQAAATAPAHGLCLDAVFYGTGPRSPIPLTEDPR